MPCLPWQVRCIVTFACLFLSFHFRSVMNFINALERIPAMIEKREKENAELSKDIPVLQEIVAASWPKDAEIKRLNEELATLNRKIQLTIKPAGGHESGTDDGTEMKGQKETGESDDTPDLPRKARHEPPFYGEFSPMFFGQCVQGPGTHSPRRC